jgi:hypothetical protein
MKITRSQLKQLIKEEMFRELTQEATSKGSSMKSTILSPEDARDKSIELGFGPEAAEEVEGLYRHAINSQWEVDEEVGIWLAIVPGTGQNAVVSAFHQTEEDENGYFEETDAIDWIRDLLENTEDSEQVDAVLDALFA